MRRFLPPFLLTLPMAAMAEVPILRVPPSIPALAEADRADVVAWQAAMPSLAIGAAFLAERTTRGPNGEHLQRTNNAYLSGEEVYFYVSSINVARADVGVPDTGFAVAMRAQVRDTTGAPLSDWLDVHTYTGTITMQTDNPEYFQNWMTGGAGAGASGGRVPTGAGIYRYPARRTRRTGTRRGRLRSVIPPISNVDLNRRALWRRCP